MTILRTGGLLVRRYAFSIPKNLPYSQPTCRNNQLPTIRPSRATARPCCCSFSLRLQQATSRRSFSAPATAAQPRKRGKNKKRPRRSRKGETPNNNNNNSSSNSNSNSNRGDYHHADRQDQKKLSGVRKIVTKKNHPRRKHRRQKEQDPVTRLQRQQAAVLSLLPHVLSSDPAWRERTAAEALKSSPSGQSASPVPSLLQREYRQLYFDSLPSFLEKLNNPEDVASLFDSKALDRLVDAGFAKPNFARQFRRTQSYRLRYKKARAESIKKELELKSRRVRLEKAAEEFERLKRRYRDLPDVPPPPPPPSSSTSPSNAVSLVGRAFKAVRDFVKPKSEEEIKQERRAELSLKNKRSDLEKRMAKKRRLVDSHTRSANATKDQLEKLQQAMESFKPPLSAEVYANTSSILAKEVMPEICRAFASYITTRHSLMVEQYKSLDATTDLTKPHEWYLHARLDRRKIIYHGGPTNSGKTYAALERLKQVNRGMYLGPLRLLAAEVYEKLTADGIYCNLYTGQEKREIPFATHGVATMEMASLVNEYDCVVIDEIQMIEDDERGFAWTRALLASRCKEIHVCGGLEAKEIVQKIAAACGDDFELQTYRRFAELTVSGRSLASRSDQVGSYKAVQRGDCVVAFSRNDIFAIKREIENLTSHKCCVIYGSLPPSTRSEQARLFNDPDSGFDVLVASDAIGMGLNLNIKRVIFNSMYKNDGNGIVQLSHSAVKQIAGRAGRRNSPYPQGIVTCRDPSDVAHLHKCMKTEVASIARAGLIPTPGHIEVFSAELDRNGMGKGPSNLHDVLQQFNDMASVKSDFFLCRRSPMVVIAQHLAHLNLPIREKYTLCMSPILTNSKNSMEILLRFATKLASGEVSGLSNNIRPKRPANFADLARLCWQYSDVEQFLWLQHKFPPGNMVEQAAALATKERLIEMIGLGLSTADKLKLDHCYVRRDQRIRNIWREEQDADDDDGDVFTSESNDDWNKGTVDM